MANNDTMTVPNSGAETIQTNILNPSVPLLSIDDSWAVGTERSVFAGPRSREWIYRTGCSPKQDSVCQARRTPRQYAHTGSNSQFAHFRNGCLTHAGLQPLAGAEQSAKAMANNDTMTVPNSGAETIGDSFDDEFQDAELNDINLDAAEMSLLSQCLLAEKQVETTQTSIAAAKGNDTEHFQKKLVRLERALAEKREKLKQYQEIKEGAVLYKRLPTDLTDLSESYFHLSSEQQPVLLKWSNLESEFLAANLPCWAPWRLLRGQAGFTDAGLAKALNKTANRPFVWG